ncbi:TPA: DUF4376 domain-containing protein [Escherichia coli]|uniref:DUF4376 domain-containing protein n=3 Tax=Escherichia coli TaxID=562 RepID=UPI001A0BF3C2|nr:DUF4376 domain-containing protein [Escherichia coli]EGO8116978.1 DUF4376 domain-containing protein [Escherichia coli]EIT9647927.1 DUF4376 domain-containing protein [Escherichia coli]EKA9547501.1 DUF4376 domain-containing protein [Escherichia coli]MCX8336587.1 DUF4376 domain-containing protein [Escherichia coli]MCX8353610.1 DUF4376 domain-containing protein [Escherichia coli]
MTFKMSEHPQTIKIYNLSAGTNEFIGEGDAWIPPHTGLPAHSTDIAPPDIPEGHVAIFDEDENTWHLMEDHRGKTVYHEETGEKLVITGPGPLPSSVTTEPPGTAADVYRDGQWVTDLSAARGIKNGEINDWRNRMENAGYIMEYNGRKWDYGKATQDRLEPSVTAARAGKLPAEFFWTDAENNDVPMSADELIALSEAVGEAMFKKGLEIHIRQREMKKELAGMDNAGEIMKFTPGWKTT